MRSLIQVIGDMFIKRLVKSAGLLACGSGCWVAGGEDEGQGGGEEGQ